jgi:uncharacterized membrane protein
MAASFELSSDERRRLRDAIADFENRTSAELKVVILKSAKGDPWDAAVAEFARLGLAKTKLRNAVLICVVVNQRKVVVLGDEGIHREFGDATWGRIVDLILAEFREGRYFAGLANAIREVGNLLVQYFPHASDDTNEVADDIVVKDDAGADSSQKPVQRQ